MVSKNNKHGENANSTLYSASMIRNYLVLFNYFAYLCLIRYFTVHFQSNNKVNYGIMSDSTSTVSNFYTHIIYVKNK